MGKELSTLAKNGYYVLEENQMGVVATKGDEKYLIKMIPLDEISRNSDLYSEIEILKINHPHIVNNKNSFKEQNMYYVVTDYCQGGNLAAKIKDRNEHLQEFEVLSWFVEICLALRKIHDNGLLQKHLTLEDVYFTEFGILCLGGYQKVYENSKNALKNTAKIRYLAPEATYDEKSDIFSLGCILYELCTKQPASTIKLKSVSRIPGGPSLTLPERFSPELCQLLYDMTNTDPYLRPTTSEILEFPFILNCLFKKTKEKVHEIQTKVDALRSLADGLERVHQGTTIGSLAGGVIGAVGGITSIVGLVLAPFTLGTSLVFTGIGVGVGAVGGVTAGASNITNMVNQSTDRKAVRNLIKDIEQKIDAVVIWLQEISNSLHTIKNRCEKLEGDDLKQENLVKIGLRAGKGLTGVAELVRLAQVTNVGRIAARATRVVRVAEVAAGALSGLFVAVDIFFVAMDAKEIYNIRQAKAAREGTSSRSVSDTATNEDMPTFDDAKLPIGGSEPDASESRNQSPPDDTPVKSEIMKFVHSIRQAADNLQKVVNELKSIIKSIHSLDRSELEWQDMELM